MRHLPITGWSIASASKRVRCENETIYGAIAQSVERLHGMQEVSGSTPLGSTNCAAMRDRPRAVVRASPVTGPKADPSFGSPPATVQARNSGIPTTEPPKGRACRREAAGQAETREERVRKDGDRRLNRGGRKRPGSPPSPRQPVHRRIARKGRLSKGSHPRASPIATVTGPNGTAAGSDAKKRLAGRRHEDVSYFLSNRAGSGWISTFLEETVSSAVEQSCANDRSPVQARHR